MVVHAKATGFGCLGRIPEGYRRYQVALTQVTLVFTGIPLYHGYEGVAKPRHVDINPELIMSLRLSVSSTSNRGLA